MSYLGFREPRELADLDAQASRVTSAPRWPRSRLVNQPRWRIVDALPVSS